MTNSIFDHIPLFILKALGITTPEEDRELEKYREGKEKLRRLIQDLKEPAYYNERRQVLQEIHVERELADFIRHRQKPFFHFRYLRWMAAAVIILLGSGISFYLLHNRQGAIVYPSYATIVPNEKQGAVLTLSNGLTQALGKRNIPITEADGSQISADSVQLSYMGVKAEETERPIYNQLTVGRGFEYMLTLQDGTKVWMNSESVLEYPIRFIETTRRVKLSGEAYFEVTHDTTRPFLVEVNGQFDVRVLGTRFNIKAYPGDDQAETTLVEGKVAIGDLVLKPSQQAVVRKEGVTEVREVRVDYYLAWHEGWFYFENERLEKALEQIGRWYNVQFTFENGDMRGIMVTGKLKRFENLSVILDMLSTTTECRFEIKEQMVYVTK